MDSADDCNKRQGDGKGQTGYINDWILKGMADSDENFRCGP